MNNNDDKNNSAGARDKEYLDEQMRRANLTVIESLLKAKSTTGIRNIHFWIIIGITAVFTYVYYGVLSGLHDIYVILFFYPLLYASIIFRLRGVIISGLVFLCILLPYVLLFNYDPYSLYRIFIFAIFAFLLSGLVATLLNYMEQQMESYIEIVTLNRELNRSIKRLESTQKQLIQSEKLNAIGQIAASIAHEINNPLAGVLVYNKLMAKKLANDSLNKEDALDNMAKIEAAVSHCSKIVRGLLDFARQSEPVLEPVEISKIIDQTVALVQHQAEMNNVEIVRNDEEHISPVKGDIGQLQQVFLNLIINAIQSIHDGGTITITTQSAEGNRVKVSVNDTGHGITPENMERLFTPFFTTKEPGKGVGLGLAISRGIVERHGGTIDVQSNAGKGSVFTVYLPLYTEDSEK
jgi:two-component system NtrC family sensor kinase